MPSKRKRKNVPGPKPSITRDVVKRVSDRVGRGLTLCLALAAEENVKINEENWKKALQAHAEFRAIYDAGKAKFLDYATQRLAMADELANLRWLLTKRHPDLFADTPLVNASTTIVGMDDNVLEQLRRVARENAKAKKQ